MCLGKDTCVQYSAHCASEVEGFDALGCILADCRVSCWPAWRMETWADVSAQCPSVAAGSPQLPSSYWALSSWRDTSCWLHIAMLIKVSCCSGEHSVACQMFCLLAASPDSLFECGSRL